jgi:dTDP-4-dehydrorhamnose reductase
MNFPSRPLLISPGGMLGRAFQGIFAERGWGYDTAERPAFDLTRRDSMVAAIQGRAWVINCSAYTDVDGAEKHEDDANAVNGRGVGWLAEICREQGATLVHFSTDYVFSGATASPYPTDAIHAPVNAYGRSKALGERLILEAGAPHLLLRTSWLYAPWGKNFVSTIAQYAKQRKELKVVNDQRGRPTSAENLVSATLHLMAVRAQAAGLDGVFHVCDDGECTWFDLASEVAAATNADCIVRPCTSAEFPRPAPRPAYSVLDLSKTAARIGALPEWRKSVRDVLERLQR